MQQGFSIPDPRFPWIGMAPQPNRGPNIVAMLDERTGEVELASSQAAVADFIARHSAARGHGGLGDLMRSITKKLGFGACEPCAKRQAAMNHLAGRVYRR